LQTQTYKFVSSFGYLLKKPGQFHTQFIEMCVVATLFTAHVTVRENEGKVKGKVAPVPN